MAFSYDPDSLSAPLNHLRLLVQDTTEAAHFFEDAEIEFIHSNSANIYRAAAALCRTIATKLVKTPSQKDSTVTFDAEARIREVRLLADEYDRQAQRLEQSLASANESASSAGEISLMAVGGGGGESAFTRDLHYSN